MNFWLALAALGGVAVACVVLPLLLRRAPAADHSATQDQLRRFEELEQDVAAGDVDAETHALLLAELERNVVDAIGTPAPAAAPRQRAPGLALCLALAIPALAVTIYLQLGQPRVAEFSARHPGADLAAPEVSIELLLDQVRARTERVPTDGEAWSVLARTNLQLGRYDEAVAAARRLVALREDDIDARMLLIDALAMQAGGAIDDPILAQLDDVLQREADNISALVLKGVALEQRGERAAAATLWQRALTLLPAEAPIRAQLEAMIGVEHVAPPAPAGTGAKVTVSVTLAVGLGDDLDPATPVFILARAAHGPAVPLAVVRRRLDELPLVVTLDESMAMVPGASLDDFAQVYVVARVARSQQPRASSGDLEGRSDIFAPAAQVEIAISIDTVLP